MFINIEMAFQEMCRQASFDTIKGKTTKPYDDGLVQPGDDIPTIKELCPSLGYFNCMYSTASNNRYRDHSGHRPVSIGGSGGQGPAEMPGAG
jgi:hypothetical protein